MGSSHGYPRQLLEYYFMYNDLGRARVGAVTSDGVESVMSPNAIGLGGGLAREAFSGFPLV